MITITVDTDGVSGNYSSLSAAIAAVPSTLTDNYTILCHATTGVLDTITGTGLTCNKTPAGFSITFDLRNGYELRHYVTADYQYTLRIKSTGVVNITGDGYGKITQWFDFATYPVTQSRPPIFFETNASTAVHSVENIKVRAVAKSYPTMANYSGICGCVTSSTTSLTIRNNQFWIEGQITTGSSQTLLSTGTTITNAYIYNNTFCGGDITTSSYWTYGNNLVGNGGKWVGALGTSLGGNKSEDTSSPDVAGRGQVFSFNSLKDHDFNIKTYDTGARNAGVSLTGQPNAPTTDMYGTTRPLGAAWDAGAHETWASTISSLSSTLTEGSTSNAITVSSFVNPLSTLTIKANGFSLACTNIVNTGAGTYTFDIPSIHQFTVNTLGVPISSFYWDNLEVEAYDGLSYAQYRITLAASTGYNSIDIADIVDTSSGSIFYGWSGTPARYDKILYPNTITIAADGLLTTDLTTGIITLFYFDQSDGYWKPFNVIISNNVNRRGIKLWLGLGI